MAEPQMAGSRKRLVEAEWDEDSNTLTFAFLADGYDDVVLPIDQLTQDLKKRGLAHGLRQKLQDSIASAKGDFATAHAKMSAVAAALLGGDWGIERGEGGGGAGALWMAALAEIKGWDMAKVKSVISNLDDATVKQIKDDAQVKGKALEIKARRAAEALEKAKAAGNLGASEESILDALA